MRIGTPWKPSDEGLYAAGLPCALRYAAAQQMSIHQRTLLLTGVQGRQSRNGRGGKVGDTLYAAPAAEKGRPTPGVYLKVGVGRLLCRATELDAQGEAPRHAALCIGLDRSCSARAHAHA